MFAFSKLNNGLFEHYTSCHQVEWFKNDGDVVHKGLQFGKVHGKLKSLKSLEQ